MTSLPHSIFLIVILLALAVAVGLWIYNSYRSAQWAYRVREENVCRCRNRDCGHVFIASRYEDSVRCPECGEVNQRGQKGTF